MPIDINQFTQTFHEECLEALETMEAGLLQLDGISAEAINGLFRAAHSIKGGAGTIGFTRLCEFTHNVETLLDAIRTGTHPADQKTADALLEACDCIRVLLDEARGASETDSNRIDAASQRLISLVQDNAHIPSNPEAALAAESGESSAGSQIGWQITVTPHENAFTAGMDPLALFQALAEMGSLTVQAHTDNLPRLIEMNAEASYLSWKIELRGDISRSALDDIFAWIVDYCDLDLKPITGDKEGSTAAQTNTDAAKPILPAATDATAASSQEPTHDKTSTIRVNTGKIDQLINIVGELVITQAMLKQVGDDFGSADTADNQLLERLREGLDQLEHNTRDLQENIMGIRMVPVSYAFSRFPRLIHDLSNKLGKSIRLDIRGEGTEIDKTLIERLNDPLVHMLRNAIDHGIETPDVRAQNGKDPTGTITLEAKHKGGNVVIELNDDGRGLDAQKIRDKAIERGLISPATTLTEKQALELVFEPGFSTAEQVSDLSGRGVGMDVVRSNVQTLGGDIELDSKPGHGTNCRVILPLTLAILDGQTVRIGQDLYVIPLAGILESMQILDKDIRRPADAIELFTWRDEQLPLIRLDSLFNSPCLADDEDRGLVVIVEGGGYRAGLTVSDLLAQQQVVIKSLDENFRKIDGFSGATILGNGTVALILDIAGIIKLASNTSSQHSQSRMEPNHV